MTRVLPLRGSVALSHSGRDAQRGKTPLMVTSADKIASALLEAKADPAMMDPVRVPPSSWRALRRDSMPCAVLRPTASSAARPQFWPTCDAWTPALSSSTPCCCGFPTALCVGGPLSARRARPVAC